VAKSARHLILSLPIQLSPNGYYPACERPKQRRPANSPPPNIPSPAAVRTPPSAANTDAIPGLERTLTYNLTTLNRPSTVPSEYRTFLSDHHLRTPTPPNTLRRTPTPARTKSDPPRAGLSLRWHCVDSPLRGIAHDGGLAPSVSRRQVRVHSLPTLNPAGQPEQRPNDGYWNASSLPSSKHCTNTAKLMAAFRRKCAGLRATARVGIRDPPAEHRPQT